MLHVLGKVLEVTDTSGEFNGKPYRSVRCSVLVGKSDVIKIRLRGPLEVQPPQEGKQVALVVSARIRGGDSGRPYIGYESDQDVTSEFYAAA